MEKAVLDAVQSQDSRNAEEPAPWKIPLRSYVAGSAVAATLLSAMLYTPVAYGEGMEALCILPQALMVAAVAGTWIGAVVSAPLDE